MADQTMQQPAGYAPQYAGGAQQGQYANYAQPQGGQPGTTVIVVQQGPTRCPDAEQVLTSGFCGCFDDCETCLCGFFCPGCAFGTWVERSGLGSCCGACCLYWLLCTYARCCMACYAGNMRSALYMKLGLPDPGCCLNWMCHCCCAPCALSQEGRAAKKLWQQNGGGKPVAPGATR